MCGRVAAIFGLIACYLPAPVLDASNALKAHRSELWVIFSPQARTNEHGTLTGLPSLLPGRNLHLRTMEIASVPHTGSVAV